MNGTEKLYKDILKIKKEYENYKEKKLLKNAQNYENIKLNKILSNKQFVDKINLKEIQIIAKKMSTDEIINWKKIDFQVSNLIIKKKLNDTERKNIYKINELKRKYINFLRENKMLKALITNYVNFTLIVQNKNFLKLIDYELLQKNARMLLGTNNSTKINWVIINAELFNFMKSKIKNLKLNIRKENYEILKLFEVIENKYKDYLNKQIVKEDLKDIDTIINNNKAQKKVLNKKLIHSNCSSDCVKVCRYNFNLPKEFLSCTKIACFCTDKEVLSKIFP